MLKYKYKKLIINKGGNKMLKKFTHLEELEEKGLIPATKEDEKAIEEYSNELAIDEYLTVDDFLRVWYNNIYIADLKQI